MIFSVPAVVYAKAHAAQNWIIFLPILSYMITWFFLEFKRIFFVEISFTLLIIIFPIASWWFWAKNDQIQSPYMIREDRSVKWQTKNLMVLDYDLSHYQSYEMYGPFLNYPVSLEMIRGQINSFEGKARIFQLIHRYDTELIYDPEDTFSGLMDELPILENSYSLEERNLYLSK
jgi:hypothetical protein